MTAEPPAPISVADYERLAEEILAPGAHAYYAGGAGDELTMHDNVAAWRRLAIRPRVPVGAGTCDTARLRHEFAADPAILEHVELKPPAAVDALEPIVQAAADRLEILIDGGIRRGTDVLKALALGARAVLVGRPILWGLSVGGDEGVRNVIELLLAEFETALALSGAIRAAAPHPSFLARPDGVRP